MVAGESPAQVLGADMKQQRLVFRRALLLFVGERMSRTVRSGLRRIAEQQEVTPLQRARMLAAAVAIKEGRVVVPIRCSHCKGTGLYEDPMRETFGEVLDDETKAKVDRKTLAKSHRLLICISCGQRTSLLTAHLQRREEISAFIRSGIDIGRSKRKKDAVERASRVC